VTYEPAALVVSVEDERGPGRAAAVEGGHAGRGLVGMRERVALFRGSLDAKPTSTGFRVVARLPIDVGSAA